MAPPHRLRTLSASATASVVALVLLAGCSSEPEPKFTDSPTSVSVSPRDSPPAEPVEPTPPPALDRSDAAGAKAFVRYYFEVLDYAQQTGDVRQIREISLGGCTACDGSTRVVTDTYKNGGTIKGGAFTISGLKVSKQGDFQGGGVTYAATANLATSQQTIKGSKDERFNKTYDPGDVDLQFLLVRPKTGWQMAQWSRVP